jgi:ATP-binding cassette, subfamily B, bacterial PglK
VRLLAEIWSVLTARQKRWVLYAQIVSIAMAFSTVAGIASIAPFFAVLGNPELIDHSRLLHGLYEMAGFSNHRSFTVALGLAFMGLVLLANLVSVAGTVVLSRLAFWIGTDLQSILFAEYLHRPYLFFIRTPGPTLFNNVVYETNRATNQILLNLFVFVTSTVTAAFIMTTVIWLNPLVAGGMIAALGGGYAAIYLAVRSRLLRAGESESHLFTEQTRIVNETLGAIKEILVLRNQEFFRSNFTRACRAFARAVGRSLLIAQSPRYIMECVAVVGLVTMALVAVADDTGIGGLLGQMTFLGFAAYRLLPTLQQAFSSLVRIRAARPGFNRIVHDLVLARNRKPPGPVDPAWHDRPADAIELREVSFSYQPDRPQALNEVSVRIPARAAVGLVGTNGSGKTTLVDIVAGLLVPSSGRVIVDGIALEEGNRASWQSRIAYVPQNIHLLDRSIAENIALGVPVPDIDRERVRAVGKLAQIDEFVRLLPGEYDHAIGERGMKLSGGQRQRIGIARALYADASVLILDEATSALDGMTEQELMSTIVRLRGRHTILLIAHRFSSVRACDLIVELHQGRVVGSGTYEELMLSSESFQQLAGV